jgi:hypothetical protein
VSNRKHEINKPTMKFILPTVIPVMLAGLIASPPIATPDTAPTTREDGIRDVFVARVVGNIDGGHTLGGIESPSKAWRFFWNGMSDRFDA